MAAKLAVGARIDEGLHKELLNIAETEKRSVSVVMGEMIAGGISNYKNGGWSAINKKDGK